MIVETDVQLKERFNSVIATAETKAKAAVDEATFNIEMLAKTKLVVQGSVKTGKLLDSIDRHVDGLEGAVTVGAYYGVYVELGTGVRGAAHQFPGKPQDITYNMDWFRGIPKEEGFEFLIPAAEAMREPFELEMAKIYG